MAVPLLSKKIVKKRVKKFRQPQSDRKICVKVSDFLALCYYFLLFFVIEISRSFCLIILSCKMQYHH